MKLCRRFARRVKVPVRTVGAAAAGYFAWGCFRYFWLELSRPGATAPGLKAHRPFQAVAQIVGFGLERSKTPDLSTGID
jgi:hypothetical protein